MRRTFLISSVLLSILVAPISPVGQTASSPLEKVLQKLDTTAAGFQSAQADFVWDQYQKVVDEHDIQKGTVYYRRLGKGKDIEMMAEIKEPDQKFVLYKDGKLQVYQPKIEQVTNYATGNNRNEVESYLVLGFGGSGAELTQAFDVSYVGEERIGNVQTAKLQLVPKSQKVRNTFSRIFLWIDLERGISVQQQFMQGEGDYRQANYSGIRLNEKLPHDVFRLKTTGKTQFVSPRG
ncbi:MAG TPA: outer-membrane lipoprotein carrier protein LolA [Candidatus Aquilonibacter sp.]|nr:outer-membrane lipoprotein carrier protein LolA [Candidatus Aquilonibacter sp.]